MAEPLTREEIFLITYLLRFTTQNNINKDIIKSELTVLANFDELWDSCILKQFIALENSPVQSTAVLLYRINNPFRLEDDKTS